MVYKSLKELEGKFLTLEDVIVFKINGIELTYVITPSYCKCIGPAGLYYKHDAIFKSLLLTEEQTKKLAEDAYGYPPFRGLWPEYRSHDLRAATRLVKRIYEIIEDGRGGLEEVPPSEYKVGDIVILEENLPQYPQLSKIAKRIKRARITKVNYYPYFIDKNKEPYYYRIEGNDFGWTSEMFKRKVEENPNISLKAIKGYTIEYFIPRKIWVKNHFANTDAKSKQVINLD